MSLHNGVLAKVNTHTIHIPFLFIEFVTVNTLPFQSYKLEYSLVSSKAATSICCSSYILQPRSSLMLVDQDQLFLPSSSPWQ